MQKEKIKRWVQDGFTLTAFKVLDESPDLSMLGEYTSKPTYPYYDRARKVVVMEPGDKEISAEEEENLGYEWERNIHRYIHKFQDYGQVSEAPVRVICTVRHEVDEDEDTGLLRYAEVGTIAEAKREPNTDPEASNAWAIVWPNNGGWGFYSTSELLAVAKVEADCPLAGLTREDLESYYLQDAERLEAYENQEWCYLGVMVEAGRAGVRLGSASIWGIESDSGDDYIESCVNDLVEGALDEAWEKLKLLQVEDVEAVKEESDGSTEADS